MSYLKTTQAAKAIGVTCPVLYRALRDGKITPPEKDGSGDYIWPPEAIQRAREELKNRRRKRATADSAA